MFLCSSFSIAAGGSLGPEAPLLALCAATTSWLGRKVQPQHKHSAISAAGPRVQLGAAAQYGELFIKLKTIWPYCTNQLSSLPACTVNRLWPRCTSWTYFPSMLERMAHLFVRRCWATAGHRCGTAP